MHTGTPSSSPRITNAKNLDADELLFNHPVGATQQGSGDRGPEPFENLAMLSFPLSIGV
jgi:hypothetical protein